MVRSKKIIIFLLITITFIALCAMNVYADSYNNISRSAQYLLSSFSVDPDVYYYDSGTVLGQMRGRTYTKLNSGGTIAFWGNFTNYCQPVLISPDQNSTAYSWGLTGYGTPVVVNGLTFYFCVTGGWSPGDYSTDLPVYTFNYATPNSDQSRQQIVAWALNEFGFSFDEPVPDPEPEPLPDNPYIPVSTGMYYTNDKLVSASSYTNLNYPFVDLPEPFQTPRDTSGPINIYAGSFIDDFSSVLTNNVVLQGQISLYVFYSNGSKFSDSTFDFSCYPVFVSGADPSFSGWSRSSVPSSWETNYHLVFDDFLKGKLLTFTYYIVTSNDLRGDLGFTPADLVFEFASSTTPIGSNFRYSLLGVTYNYCYRETSSSPLPSDPNNTILPNINNGYTGSNIHNYNAESAAQLAYFQDILHVYSDRLDFTIQGLADILVPQDNYNTLFTVLNTLYDSVSYDGTSFDFKFPSATIPWFGSSNTLKLWNEKTIPFQTYIDGIPSQYITIITFIVLFSGFSIAIIYPFHLLFVMLRGNAKIDV